MYVFMPVFGRVYLTKRSKCVTRGYWQIGSKNGDAGIPVKLPEVLAERRPSPVSSSSVLTMHPEGCAE